VRWVEKALLSSVSAVGARFFAFVFHADGFNINKEQRLCWHQILRMPHNTTLLPIAQHSATNALVFAEAALKIRYGCTVTPLKAHRKNAIFKNVKNLIIIIFKKSIDLKVASHFIISLC
jgi:hypothetical protein